MLQLQRPVTKILFLIFTILSCLLIYKGISISSAYNRAPEPILRKMSSGAEVGPYLHLRQLQWESRVLCVFSKGEEHTKKIVDDFVAHNRYFVNNDVLYFIIIPNSPTSEATAENTEKAATIMQITNAPAPLAPQNIQMLKKRLQLSQNTVLVGKDGRVKWVGDNPNVKTILDVLSERDTLIQKPNRVRSKKRKTL